MTLRSLLQSIKYLSDFTIMRRNVQIMKPANKSNEKSSDIKPTGKTKQ
jgi:hypothetical protein